MGLFRFSFYIISRLMIFSLSTLTKIFTYCVGRASGFSHPRKSRARSINN